MVKTVVGASLTAQAYREHGSISINASGNEEVKIVVTYVVPNTDPYLQYFSRKSKTQENTYEKPQYCSLSRPCA